MTDAEAFTRDKGKIESLEIASALHAADISGIKTDIAQLNTTVGTLSSSVSAGFHNLTEAMNARGRTPWMLLIGGAGLLVTVMTALLTVGWFLINQNVQLSLSPVSSTLGRVSENQKAHDEQIGRLVRGIDELSKTTLQSSLSDVQSRTDRGQLNERVRSIEDHQAQNLADRKAETASLAAKEVEVETQFRANDRIRNLQFANLQQFVAILWNKGHPGEPFPGLTYFPEIARDIGAAKP